MASVFKKIQALLLDEDKDVTKYEDHFEKSDQLIKDFNKRRAFAQSCLNAAKIKKAKQAGNKKDKDKEAKDSSRQVESDVD